MACRPRAYRPIVFKLPCFTAHKEGSVLLGYHLPFTHPAWLHCSRKGCVDGYLLYCYLYYFYQVFYIVIVGTVRHGAPALLIKKICYRRLTARRDVSVKKKLSYRRGTARCVVSIEILPIATQQCKNYLYDKY